MHLFDMFFFLIDDALALRIYLMLSESYVALGSKFISFYSRTVFQYPVKSSSNSRKLNGAAV